MGEPVISAVLLNYKGTDDTIECINSLLQSACASLNIVLVDNLSPDDSFVRLQQFLLALNVPVAIYPSPAAAMADSGPQARITLIQSGENKGYGHGNNIGIRFALHHQADFLLILNNDTVVDKDFLQPLLTACQQDNTIGIATGKIYFYQKPDHLWYAGGKFSPITGRTEHFLHGQKDTGQAIPQPVTFVTGCFWFVPAAVFSNVGLINEDYFMYVEDLEFCYRLLQQGLRIELCPQSRIYHKTSASSGGDFNPFATYWKSRNKIRLIRQCWPFPQSIAAVLYALCYMSFKWIYLGKAYLLKPHLQGFIHGFLNK